MAWRQPVTHPNRAKAVYFSLKPKQTSAFEDPLPRLEGTIKFGVKRYLHLEADILLRTENGETTAEQDYSPRIRSYRMQDKRRMRSGKLHYLDHPVLGILTIAKRYEMPKPKAVAVEPQATEEASPPDEEASETPQSNN
jgi:hypothetical protein